MEAKMAEMTGRGQIVCSRQTGRCGGGFSHSDVVSIPCRWMWCCSAALLLLLLLGLFSCTATRYGAAAANHAGYVCG